MINITRKKRGYLVNEKLVPYHMETFRDSSGTYYQDRIYEPNEELKSLSAEEQVALLNYVKAWNEKLKKTTRV